MEQLARKIDGHNPNQMSKVHDAKDGGHDMKHLLGMALPALLLAGCGAKEDPKVPALEKRLATLESRVDEERSERERLVAENQSLRKALDAVKPEKREPTPAGITRDEMQKELDDLARALRKEFGRPATSTQPAKPETKPEAKAAPASEPTDADKAKKIEEAKAKLSDKLTRFYADLADRALTQEVYELLWQADGKTRKEVVDKLKAMVAENPEDKHLRLALANALLTTFADVKPGIEQGVLAGAVMREAKTAEKIDPDYYDAVAFIAVYKANYPEGFVEFNEAWKDLDKALAMQAKMPWEDRFGDIYAAYGAWYFKQKKYDEAMAKVQAGLDKDARNPQLIELKKRIEDARK